MSQTPAQSRELIAQGRFDEAEKLLLRAVRADAASPSMLSQLAVALTRQAKHEQGLYYARRAVAAGANEFHDLWGVAMALSNAHQGEESLAVLEKCLKLVESPVVRQQTIVTLTALHHHARAEALCRDSLSRYPDDAGMLLSLLSCRFALGDRAEASAIASRLAARHPDVPGILERVAQLSNYDPMIDCVESRRHHERYARALRRALHIPPFEHSPADDPDRPLRIGIVSPEIRRHSVAFFAEPLLIALRSFPGVVLTIYYNGIREDDTTRRLKAHAHEFRHAPDASPAALAGQIRRNGTDILFDLSALGDNPSTAALWLKPAPVQINAIAYPNTTGCPSVDYRLVDAITDPPEHDDHLVETPLRLDECFLCYRPDPAVLAMPARGSAFDPGAPVTLGSFNLAAKLSDPTLDAWATILRSSPAARLLLKNAALVDERGRSILLDRFAARGIEPHRLELVGSIPSFVEHMQLYQRVDLALDPFPYHGTTTTCEALSMGVPTLTLLGDRHVSRVGASLNVAAGLSELVASSVDEYIDKAVALAGDPSRLASIRHDLRERFLASPLCDQAHYTRQIHAAVRDVWSRRCSIGAPAAALSPLSV